MTDISSLRKDFPILNEQVYGKSLVYLDNAATTQKPRPVIRAISEYYEQYNSNVHRGVHYLSQKATDAQEAARKRIAAFIHAAHDHEIIFTRGTTEGINLVAYSFCKQFVRPGDEIIITAMEHHSNIVPWQIACEDHKATLKILPINHAGELLYDQLDTLITERTRLIAATWVSNTLGTVNDVATIISKAHAQHIPVLLDAAQAIQHFPVDVQQLDADFLVFSGHKIYGPTGIGVLYGKERYLEAMPPYQAGGSMIREVRFDKTTYAALPFKFEAGTPHISGIIGLDAAIRYVQEAGIEAIGHYEQELIQYAAQQLALIPGLRFIGEAGTRAGALSFLVGSVHPFDLGELLDKQGIAVRTGHHCCQPLMDFYTIPGTVRASFSFYNTHDDIDRLKSGIEKSVAMLA